MSSWTKRRRELGLCFEVARRKEIISRQRDNMWKTLFFWRSRYLAKLLLIVVLSDRPPSALHIMLQKVYTEFLRASVYLCLKWKYSLKCKWHFWKQKKLYIYCEVIYTAEHINSLTIEEKLKIRLLGHFY
jgi:hypothetical protein